MIWVYWMDLSTVSFGSRLYESWKKLICVFLLEFYRVCLIEYNFCHFGPEKLGFPTRFWFKKFLGLKENMNRAYVLKLKTGFHTEILTGWDWKNWLFFWNFIGFVWLSTIFATLVQKNLDSQQDFFSRKNFGSEREFEQSLCIEKRDRVG